MQARASAYTDPIKTAYVRDQPRAKNIGHMHSSTNHIAHTAPDPERPARADHKMNAKGLQSNWGNPNVKDKDMFSSPQKRTRPGVSQFATSDILYGGKEEVKQQKKSSSVKCAELGGSNAVTHLTPAQLKQQNLAYGSSKKRADAIGVRGSSGIMGSVHEYKDNDITYNLVNSKHTGNRADGKRADHKPKAQAEWNYPKGDYKKSQFALHL